MSSPTIHAQAMSYSNPASRQPKLSNAVDSPKPPPTGFLARHWSTNQESLIQDFNNHFDHNEYGIPRPMPMAQEPSNVEILMECASRYLLYNAISDELVRIDHPTRLSEILKATAMPHSEPVEGKELDRLPREENFRNTYGWSFDAKTLNALFQRVPVPDYGLSHLTPVMAQEEEGLLLFRQDYVQQPWDEEWKYFIWDQKSIYRVDEPASLDDMVEFLMVNGFRDNKNLRTTKLGKAEREPLNHETSGDSVISTESS